MKTRCPMCQTEMIERSNMHFCPRNDIGECAFDPLNLESNEMSFLNLRPLSPSTEVAANPTHFSASN